MIAVYSRNSVMCMTSKGFAHVVVDNNAAHSLTGNGDPQTLLGVMRRAEVFVKGDTMVCVVEFNNPLRRRLRKVYRKFGFNPVGTIMEKVIK